MSFRLGCLLLLLISFAGCATQPPELTTQPGVSLSGRKLIVAPTVNETGKAYDFDIAQVFTSDLQSALQAKGYELASMSQPPPDAVIVQCTFLSYAPGNAAKRWLLPGWGSTEATVKTSLVDHATGRIVGGMLTRKEVAGGGLLSVGADESILQTIADDVAGAINDKVRGS